MNMRVNLLGAWPLGRKDAHRTRSRLRMREVRARPGWHAAFNEQRRQRYATDPEFREERKQLARRESWRRYYYESGYREAQEARQRAQRSNPETWALSVMRGLRNRAKARGLEFAITAADVPVTLVCPVFGTPLRYGGPVGHPDNPSVDRIDNRKGYVPGNLWVISHRANTLKNNATLDELETLVAALRKAMGAP
jgi:hypothetical protein